MHAVKCCTRTQSRSPLAGKRPSLPHTFLHSTASHWACKQLCQAARYTVSGCSTIHACPLMLTKRGWLSRASRPTFASENNYKRRSTYWPPQCCRTNYCNHCCSAACVASCCCQHQPDKHCITGKLNLAPSALGLTQWTWAGS